MLVNPPWVNSHRVVMQAWVRRVCLNFMGGSGRVRLLRDVDDLFQDVFLKVARSQETVIELNHKEFWLAHHPSRDEEIRYWLSLKIAFHIALFLAAFNLLKRTFFLFSKIDLRRLKNLRDKVKSLSLPINFIPQSLHPIESAAL